MGLPNIYHHSAILEATTDFVGIASADGRLQYVNPAGLEMCGFEKETDVIKYRVQDFHPEWTNKLLREEFFPICAKEGVWSGELEFLHQDGHEILTSAVIVGHKLQNGELAHVSTISRKITEYRGLEQALRESEEKFRKVTELAIEGIILANQNGEITSWNKGAQTIFGYTEDEVLDKEIAFLMPKRYRDDHRKGLQRVTSTGKSSLLGKTLKLVGERKDGTEFPLELSLTSWTTPQERVYNAIIRDITERRQDEESRQALEAKVQQAQRLESLGVLAGGIAHDFNNLLTGILGCADLALLKLAPTDPVRRLVEQIVAGTQNAATLTNQMLAYSGRGKFLIQPLQISEVIQEITHLLEVSISKNCVLEYHFADNLPAVEADTAQLRQLIMNLIINASEAIGERSGSRCDCSEHRGNRM